MKEGEAEVAAKRTTWVGITGQCTGQKLSLLPAKCRAKPQVCDPAESFTPVSQDGAAAQPLRNLRLCWQQQKPTAVPMCTGARVYFS